MNEETESPREPEEFDPDKMLSIWRSYMIEVKWLKTLVKNRWRECPLSPVEFGILEVEERNWARPLGRAFAFRLANAEFDPLAGELYT